MCAPCAAVLWRNERAGMGLSWGAAIIPIALTPEKFRKTGQASREFFCAAFQPGPSGDRAPAAGAFSRRRGKNPPDPLFLVPRFGPVLPERLSRAVEIPAVLGVRTAETGPAVGVFFNQDLNLSP